MSELPSCWYHRHFILIFYSHFLLLLGARIVLSAHLCPPLNLETVDADCKLWGEVIPCDGHLKPGTIASFKCKPLHEFLFGLVPSSGNSSTCKEDGSWSATPFSCVPVCGTPSFSGTPLVRGGKPVPSAAKFPWHVSVYLKSNIDQSICGGSLIARKYFISAAHCFSNDNTLHPASRYTAAIGKIRQASNATEDIKAQRIDVKEIFVKNYGYHRLAFANDIALVELVNEAIISSTVLPVCIDWWKTLPELKDGDNGTVIGYGLDPYGQHKELQYAGMMYVSKDICRDAVGHKLQSYVTQPDKFCVGSTNGTGVSQGDSGGGMTFEYESRWYLRGVVSVGSRNAMKGPEYAFFTNVDFFSEWIASKVSIPEAGGQECGVSNIKAEPGAKLLENDNFPWDVTVFARNGSHWKRWTNGVLVHSLLVLVSWDPYSDAIFQPSDLRVVPGSWRSFSNSLRNVTRVQKTHFPREEISNSFLYSVAILELKERLQLMPACVLGTERKTTEEDDAGEEVAGAIVEEHGRTKRWLQLPLISSTTCKSQMDADFVDVYNICTPFGDLNDSRPPVVYQKAKYNWYVRGALNSHYSTNSTGVLTDLADEGIQRWILSVRTNVNAGGCGRLSDIHDLPEKDVARNSHLPWNVAVHVNMTEGNECTILNQKSDNDTDQGSSSNERNLWGNDEVLIIAGTLVKSNVVITSHPLLTKRHRIRASACFPSSSFLVLSEAKRGGILKSEVSRVYVLEHDYGLDVETGWNMVVLNLKQDLALMPVCVDISGSSISPLVTFQSGAVETWSNYEVPSSRFLNSAHFIKRAACLRRLEWNKLSPKDVFCVGPFDGGLLSGSGFFSLKDDTWYLRGMYAFSWDNAPVTELLPGFVGGDQVSTGGVNNQNIRFNTSSSEKIHAFTDIVTPPLRKWLFRIFTDAERKSKLRKILISLVG